MLHERLSQIKHINKEIELLKRQIESVEYGIKDLKLATDSVKGSSPTFPYTEHSILITGVTDVDYESYYKRVNRLRDKLQRRLEDLMDGVEEANEYIEGVQDSEMRMILTLRYINGLSWHQVAAHIGESDESYPRRKHNRFLKLAENAEKKCVII